MSPRHFDRFCRRCVTSQPHACTPRAWQCECGVVIEGWAGQIIRAVEVHERSGCRAVGRAVELRDVA